ILLGSLYETLPKVSAISYLVLAPTVSGVVFDALAEKSGPVKEAAEYAIQALYNILISDSTSPLHNISSELGVAYLSSSVLCAYLTSAKAKPQGKIGALDLLAKLAERMTALSEELGED